jgi:hypothetical protein
MVTKKARPKKSTRAKKNASKRRAGAGGKSKPTLLRTQFMADFTKKFIKQGRTYVWPARGSKRADVVAEFQAFVKVLVTVGYGLPAPINNGPLGDQVAQFLGATPPPTWPNNPAGLSPRFQKRLPTVALVDIAVILDRLLEAINRFDLSGGPGGIPGGWPPH